MAISWTKTAGELAAMSAQRVQMLGAGQSLTGHRWTLWMDHCNDFLKVVQTKGPNEWRRATQTISTPTLAAGTASYALSIRPYKVHDFIYWRDANSRDMPITRWNQDTYENLPYKTTPGVPPTCFVVDRQRTATTITLWPVPNVVTGCSLRIPYDRVIEDVAAPADTVDVPQEWLGPVADLLGVRLADSFNLASPAIDRVRERADLWFNELLGDDHDASVIFTMESN